ncbi:3-hydroxybutyryl-CoA dehydrogenase [soil metagenome]
MGSDDELNSEIKELFAASEFTSKKPDLIIESTIYDEDLKFKNLSLIEQTYGTVVPVLSCSNVITLREQYVKCGLVSNMTGISLYKSFSKGKGIEISLTEHTNIDLFNKALKFFEGLRNIHKVTDRTGMIALRIIILIINEAFLVRQEGTSVEADINTAMKLGTNYPYGPFEWCELIGVDVVYNLLKKLHSEFGDDRYRITPLLKEMYLNSLINKTE